MKNEKFFTLFVLILIFSYIPLSFPNLQIQIYETGIIVVPDNYSSIQKAVNNAKEGQKIFVRSGSYQEYVTIDKSISIYGENREDTVIEGNGSHILLEIHSDNVTISNLWLRNAETALYLKNVNNCRIFQIKITNIKFDVYAGKSSGTAIYIEKSNNTIIEGNIITDVYYTHVLLEEANRNQIRDNLFIANTRWSQALLLRTSHKNLIEWNKIYGTPKINEGGIGAIFSVGNIIQFNDIKQNDWCGISLHSSNGTIIKGNNITDHKILFGLYLKRTENTTVYCNNFVNNIEDVNVYQAENTRWSFQGLGNYWENYKGVDKNQDGIGDSAYGFEGEKDPFPLMGKYHCFKLHFNDEIKMLEVVSNATIWLDTNQTPERGIVFRSKGQLGDYAFCLIKIPKEILENLNVTVNGEEPVILKTLVESYEFSITYILYIHKYTEDIVFIIPEFASLSILTLVFLVITLMLQKEMMRCR